MMWECYAVFVFTCNETSARLIKWWPIHDLIACTGCPKWRSRILLNVTGTKSLAFDIFCNINFQVWKLNTFFCFILKFTFTKTTYSKHASYLPFDHHVWMSWNNVIETLITYASFATLLLTFWPLVIKWHSYPWPRSAKKMRNHLVSRCCLFLGVTIERKSWKSYILSTYLRVIHYFIANKA